MSLDFILSKRENDILKILSSDIHKSDIEIDGFFGSASLSADLGNYVSGTLTGVQSHFISGETSYGVTEIGPVYFDYSRFSSLCEFFKGWLSIFKSYEKQIAVLKNPETGYDEEEEVYYEMKIDIVKKELTDVIDLIEKAIQMQDDSLIIYGCL